MPMRSYFLFQRGNSEYYALSAERYCKRRLPNDLGNGEWQFRGRIHSRNAGAAYFEVAKLLKDRPICLLKLRTEGIFQCCCSESPHGSDPTCKAPASGGTAGARQGLLMLEGVQRI